MPEPNGRLKIPYHIAIQIIIIVVSVAALFGGYKVLTHFTLEDIKNNTIQIAKNEDNVEKNGKEILITQGNIKLVQKDVSYLVKSVDEIKEMLKK